MQPALMTSLIACLRRDWIRSGETSACSSKDPRLSLRIATRIAGWRSRRVRTMKAAKRLTAEERIDAEF